MLTILLIVIILVVLFGGGFYGGADGTYPYRTGGIGIGGILLICLLIYLFMGHRL
jgi:hypothetical protein